MNDENPLGCLSAPLKLELWKVDPQIGRRIWLKAWNVKRLAAQSMPPPLEDRRGQGGGRGEGCEKTWRVMTNRYVKKKMEIDPGGGDGKRRCENCVFPA